MVRCPICGHEWKLFDVEAHHHKGVKCAFCRIGLALERFELVDGAGTVIDVLWPLIRIGASPN